MFTSLKMWMAAAAIAGTAAVVQPVRADHFGVGFGIGVVPQVRTYVQPAPYYYQPTFVAPSYYYPQPTYYYGAPAYYPQPTYYYPQPTYYYSQPYYAPSVSFSFGGVFGGGGHGGRRLSFGRW